MSGDPNLPAPPAPEPAPTPARPGRLTCENCQCQLTPTGDVFRMSDQAREWLRAAEDLRAARAEARDARQQLETVQGELTAARAEIARLSAPPADEKKKSFWNR